MRALVLLVALVGCASHQTFGPDGNLVSKTTARGDSTVSICNGRYFQDEQGLWTCVGVHSVVDGGQLSSEGGSAIETVVGLPGTAVRAVLLPGG